MVNFDRVVPFYDRLARLVFGSAWGEVQRAPIVKISQVSNLLVVGGGTGAILPELSSVPRIVYLDISKDMLRQARNRKAMNTEFVHGDFLHWHTDERFEAILLPFFLDCFPKDQTAQAIRQAKNLLQPKGQLHVVDFQQAASWKNLLVRVMYFFFRISTGLAGDKLLDIHGMIRAEGLETVEEQFFLNRWIFYRSYRVTVPADKVPSFF